MKNQLQWQEPRAFRRAEYRERQKQNPWDAPKTAAVSFAIILALRGFVGLTRPNANLLGWGPITLLALAVGFVVAYVLPFALGYLAVSLVILSEKGVNNNIVGHGATIYFWPWDQIGHCSFDQKTTGGRSFACLFLHDHQGEVIEALALPEKPPREEIQSWLHQCGKADPANFN